VSLNQQSWCIESLLWDEYMLSIAYTKNCNNFIVFNISLNFDASWWLFEKYFVIKEL